jgi:hypothetical protein
MYHFRYLFTEMTSDEVADKCFKSEMSCSVFLLLFRFAYLHRAQQANREGDFGFCCRHVHFVKEVFYVCARPARHTSESKDKGCFFEFSLQSPHSFSL